MKKKSSIIKLCIIGVVIIIGFVLSFCTFDLGIKTFNSFTANIKLGLDLKGGIYAEYVAIDDETDDIDSRMEGTVTSIQNLLVQKGYTEATVVRQGGNGIRVEVPNVDNPSSILEILGEPVNLYFRLTDGTTILTGNNIVNAVAGYDATEGYIVSLEFDAEGAQLFGEATSAHVGETMEIVTAAGDDPNDETVISTATIREAITGGRTMISGQFTQQTAEDLANQIMSGTFGVTLSLQKCDPISATLGEGAIKYGLIAGLVGLALVMVFMCLVYRRLGIVASIVLMIYTILMFLFLAVFPWVQLTLPGIAGILLSIGMAIDGNVIIFERIKDEYRNGKSIMASFHYGFSKSVSAIVDGNVTTIISAGILALVGTGSIKGFAYTLLIGLVLSVLCSLIVTRGILKYFAAINHDDNKVYNLYRGERYVDLKANENDAAVQLQIDTENARKEEERKRRELEKNNKIEKGGEA